MIALGHFVLSTPLIPTAVRSASRDYSRVRVHLSQHRALKPDAQARECVAFPSLARLEVAPAPCFPENTSPKRKRVNTMTRVFRESSLACAAGLYC